MAIKKTLKASPIYYRQWGNSTDCAGSSVTATVNLGSTPVADALLYFGSLEQRGYSAPNVRNHAMTGYSWTATGPTFEVTSDYPPVAFAIGKATGAAKGTAFTVYHDGHWSGDSIWEFPYLKGDIVSSYSSWAWNPSSASIATLRPVEERGLMAVALFAFGTGSPNVSLSSYAWSTTGTSGYSLTGWSNAVLAYLIDPPIGSTPAFSFSIGGTLKPMTSAMLLLR